MTPVRKSINRLTAAVPLYIQIAEGLIAQIEQGDLTPGDRLPPERELSETLGVNRMTLRQALRVLDAQGLLIRQRGSGTYIAEPKIEREAGSPRGIRLVDGLRSFEVPLLGQIAASAEAISFSDDHDDEIELTPDIV